MNRGEIAKQFFLDGYNCSQAVALAFADMLNMDKSTIAKTVSGFGGGIGRRRDTCGSVTGMVFVYSSLYGYDDPKDFDNKKNLYADIQQLTNEFEQINGSIICRELLGLEIKGSDSPTPEQRTPQYYKKRPCHELVQCSAEILQKFIESKENKKI